MPKIHMHIIKRSPACIFVNRTYVVKGPTQCNQTVTVTNGEVFPNMVGILTAPASLFAASCANPGAAVNRERFEGKVGGVGCMQISSRTLSP